MVTRLRSCRPVITTLTIPPPAAKAAPAQPRAAAAPAPVAAPPAAESAASGKALLAKLADALGARHTPPAQVATLERPALPGPGRDPIEPMGLGRLIAALIPENAVVIDEAGREVDASIALELGVLLELGRLLVAGARQRRMTRLTLFVDLLLLRGQRRRARRARARAVAWAATGRRVV